MIKESEKQQIEKKSMEEQIKTAEEIIKAAAVYERLAINADYKTMIGHLEGLRDIHQDQINGWMNQMAGASFFKRIKFMDVMLIHQVRKEQLQEAINYPKQLMHAANEAREFMKKHRKKETANA